MGSDDIVVYEGYENPGSYEEINRYITEGNNAELNMLDKASNWYDNIPRLIKIVAKNIDKTGIISGLDEFLTGHKAKKEQERLIISVAFLYDMFLKQTSQLQQAMETLKGEFQVLTEEYFNKCKESHQREKLRIFRDVWFNSITNFESSYDEKDYVFNLVSELTVDQINVLKYIYLQTEKDIKEKGRSHTVPINVQKYADERELPYIYVQQICVNLSGKGLLNQGASTFIKAEATDFLPSAFVDTLIKYLKSCD